MRTVIKFIKVTYAEAKVQNYVIPNGSIVFITNLPWYKSWFGLKPTRLVLGDGVTPILKLKYV